MSIPASLLCNQGCATHSCVPAQHTQPSGERWGERLLQPLQAPCVLSHYHILSQQLLRFMNLNTHKTLGSCSRKWRELGPPDDVWWGDTIGILLVAQCWWCFCDTVRAHWGSCSCVRIRLSGSAVLKEKGCSKSQAGLSGSALSWPVWSCSLNRKTTWTLYLNIPLRITKPHFWSSSGQEQLWGLEDFVAPVIWDLLPWSVQGDELWEVWAKEVGLHHCIPNSSCTCRCAKASCAAVAAQGT